MTKTVASSRLIAGLLSEVEASATPVFCTDTVTQEEFSSKLTLEQTPKGLRVRVGDGLVHELSCEVLLLGKRIAFKLKNTSSIAGEIFTLPEEVLISDLRTTPRLALKDEAYPAEVRYLGGVLLGFASDISSNHLSVDIPTLKDASSLRKSDRFEVIVRGGADKVDVFSGRCSLSYVQTNGAISRLIFKSEKVKSSEKNQRPKRRNALGHAIKYRGFRSEDLNYQGIIHLTDISLTGFSGTAEYQNGKQCPILGLVVASDDPKCKFMAVRKDGNSYGFVVIDADSPFHGSEWLTFLQKFRFPDRVDLVCASDLAELFVESNFLKYARLGTYAGRLSEHLAHTADMSSPALVRRHLKSDDGLAVTHNISLFRITDSSWLLHEVAAGLNKASGIKSLYGEVIGSIAEEARFIGSTPKFLCVYYNPTIQVVAKQWLELNAGVGCRHFPVRVITLQPAASNTKRSSLGVCEFTESGPEIIDSMMESFDSAFLASLGLSGLHSTNQFLPLLLKAYGPSHRVQIKLIFSFNKSGDAVVAIAYRVFSHYSANTTGVINSLFLFFKDGVRAEEIDEAIVSVQGDESLLLGTSDVIMVFPSESEANSYSDDKAKKFNWLIFDLQTWNDDNEE